MYRQHDPRRSTSRDDDQGFTLIELLIVIAILGILSTIVVLSVRGITDRGSDAACTTDEKTLRSAYEIYAANATPAFDAGGPVTFEDFLVDNGYLNTASEKYDVAADGSVTAQAGGGCDASSTTAAGSTTAAPVPANGVTAGAPGTWLPSGATPPANKVTLISSGLAPSNPAPWSPSQYVTLGDGSLVTWWGTTTGWLDALPSDALPGTPGSWLPSGVTPFADIGDLLASGFVPANTAAWPLGTYVLLGDNTGAWWMGSAWVQVPVG